MQNQNIVHWLKQKAPQRAWWIGVCLLSMVLIFQTVAAHQDVPAVDYPRLLRYGMLNLLDNVNQKDAQVVIEMKFVNRHRKQFPGIGAKLEILPDVATAASLFKQKRMHGISLTGIDYLALKELAPIVPLFISSRQDKPLEAYVLLVSKSVTSINQLAKLPKRRLVMENLGEAYIGQVWLDTVLWEHKHAESKSFFTNIRQANTLARIVLPVFFEQAEACLVPESAYETMAELNPQISQRLRVLIKSPDFVRAVHCAIDNLNPELVEAMKSNAINLPNTVDGQQLMTIFQIKRIFLFNQDYMKETERVFHLYRETIATH